VAALREIGYRLVDVVYVEAQLEPTGAGSTGRP
jgi:hypothetical protein